MATQTTETYTVTLNIADVTYTVEARESDTPIEGNVMVSGDDTADSEAETWVRAELERGNIYAWCDVTVIAKLGPYTGKSHLGAVSAASELDFKNCIEDHDMRDEALTALRDSLLGAGFNIRGA